MRNANARDDRVHIAIDTVGSGTHLILVSIFVDTQPAHSERQIVKVVGPVLEKKEAYELPPDIDHHGFSKFSNIYFKVPTTDCTVYVQRMYAFASAGALIRE